MAFLGRDGQYDPFNPLHNRRSSNPPRQAELQQPPTFGTNPFSPPSRANRSTGITPLFVFDTQTEEPPRWRSQADGNWFLKINTQRQPIRVAIYDEHKGYVRTQRRAFGPPPEGPAPAPAPVAPVPPPVPVAADLDEVADPPVILFGPTGNAAIQVTGPLLHFAMQWTAFLVCAAFAVWAMVPTVVSTIVAAHRFVAVLPDSLLEARGWAFGLDMQWPRGSLISYTLCPGYTSRAVAWLIALGAALEINL
jgi:hypothetical protein